MKNSIFLFSTLLLALFASCTSTQITSSWREPNKEVRLDKLRKVLVVALFDGETSRRKAEDQMVKYLDGKGVVSYDYLNPKFDEENEEALRKKIKKDGFDGAITMRLIDVDKEKVFTADNMDAYPGYYRNFSGYYFQNWGYNSAPGYYSTTKTYTVETNVFSIKEDKIIWTGLTETTDPKGVTKMTEEITKVIYRKMRSEGFIGKN